MNPDDIEEGDDVYFECKVHANPNAYKVIWKHNVSDTYMIHLTELWKWQTKQSDLQFDRENWYHDIYIYIVYISKIIYQVCNDHTSYILYRKRFRVRVYSSLNSLNAAVLHLFSFFCISFQQNPIHINDISFVLQAFSKWNERQETNASPNDDTIAITIEIVL